MIECTATGTAAVVMEGAGDDKFLVNTGVIQSVMPEGGTGVQINGANVTVIDNAGTIRSVGGLAIDASMATGSLVLTNSRAIIGSVAVTLAVVGTAQADVISNTGTIIRSVSLGDGDDTFDGIGGTVGGTVFGGDGNDTYRLSDPLARVYDEIGEGAFDAIVATVSYSLATSGEVENLELLGTATHGTGNALNNFLNGNDMDNRLRGDAGLDTIYGGYGEDRLFGDDGNDFAYGGYGEDTLRGGAAADTLYGGASDDTLRGDAGADRLYGDDGEDVLHGGGGRDTLYGGADADAFEFRFATDSRPGSTLRDLILGFEAGLDVIDLGQIDANANTTGNQAFTWIGTAAFGSIAGQLRLITGANSILQGDLTGDGVADFEVQFNAAGSVSVNDILL